MSLARCRVTSRDFVPGSVQGRNLILYNDFPMPYIHIRRRARLFNAVVSLLVVIQRDGGGQSKRYHDYQKPLLSTTINQTQIL